MKRVKLLLHMHPLSFSRALLTSRERERGGTQSDWNPETTRAQWRNRDHPQKKKNRRREQPFQNSFIFKFELRKKAGVYVYVTVKVGLILRRLGRAPIANRAKVRYAMFFFLSWLAAGRENPPTTLTKATRSFSASGNTCLRYSRERERGSYTWPKKHRQLVSLPRLTVGAATHLTSVLSLSLSLPPSYSAGSIDYNWGVDLPSFLHNR